MSQPRIGTGADGPIALCVVRPTLGQGGADRVTVTLLRNLDRRRFRPILVLMRAEGALLSEVPDDVPVFQPGGGSLWTAWWPLAQTLRRLGPDVVLSTSSGTNPVVVVARWLSRRPMRLVLSERNVLYRDQRPLSRWLQIRLKRWLYPRADRVTAVSEGVAEDLARHLALPLEAIRVVYNPVVTPRIAALAAAESPHRWFEEPPPVVLGAGRLVPAKGFDLLLEAVARLRQPARLVVLGEGPQRPALERQARNLGLTDRVCFAGFDPNPFRYMARCGVFALSSRHEGLPGVLIQAMACGCAVVAADCHAGPAEIVEDGISGLLTPVGDPVAMASKIDRLLVDPDLRDRIAKRARSDVAQRFGLDAAMARYSEALSLPPSRGAATGKA